MGRGLLDRSTATETDEVEAVLGGKITAVAPIGPREIEAVEPGSSTDDMPPFGLVVPAVGKLPDVPYHVDDAVIAGALGM